MSTRFENEMNKSLERIGFHIDVMLTVHHKLLQLRNTKDLVDVPTAHTMDIAKELMDRAVFLFEDARNEVEATMEKCGTQKECRQVVAYCERRIAKHRDKLEGLFSKPDAFRRIG